MLYTLYMRTDKYKPSTIDPECLEFVGLEHMKMDIGDCSMVLANREIIRAHQDSTGATWSNHTHGGNCHICGAWCIYTACFYDRVENVYIRVGMICAEKLNWGDPALFKSFRRACLDALHNKAGKAKAEAILESEGLGHCWKIFTGQAELLSDKAVANAAETICDIVSKLVKYGDISASQMTFLHGLVKRIANWPEIKAQREVEHASAADCPTGRLVLSGEIVKTDQQFNEFGGRMVMTVKCDAGFLIWGSIPSALAGIQRGEQISFTATVTPSDKDPKFGFFKRPTKASLQEA